MQEWVDSRVCSAMASHALPSRGVGKRPAMLNHSQPRSATASHALAQYREAFLATGLESECLFLSCDHTLQQSLPAHTGGTLEGDILHPEICPPCEAEGKDRRKRKERRASYGAI